MPAAVHELEFAEPHAASPSGKGGLKLLARLERTYAVGRCLSLDVALAALGGGVMAGRIFQVHPRPAFYLLLPAGAWVAYTLDHLLDAHRVGPAAQTPRHRLHFRHARPLWTLLAVVALAALLLGCTELSYTGLMFGIGLAGLCLAHETIVKVAGARASPLLIKELGVAIIFTAGTWGLPLLLRLRDHTQPPLALGLVLPLIQYLLLALVNLLEFSVYEAAADARDRHTSFVLAVGTTAARRTTAGLLAAQLPLAAVALTTSPTYATWRLEMLFAVMTLLLIAVLLAPAALGKHERYRTLGDGAFLLPLLLLVR